MNWGLVGIYIGGTLALAWISRSSLRDPRSHGFYRFLAWEAILALVVLALPAWFLEPFSLRQIGSWILLLGSIYPVVEGLRLLHERGRPDDSRGGETLLGLEKTTALVTGGLYGLIRHPMYTSLLMLAWGVFLKILTLSGLGLVLAASIFLYQTAKIEEGENIAYFGEPYVEYLRRTKKFIPYLFKPCGGHMPLAPFKLERYFAQYEFNLPYIMCASDCESRPVADLLAFEPGAEERFKAHWLGYTESAGSPALRREISRIYTAIQPEQVLVHSGAEEAIFLFLNAVLGPRDHAVVHWPCYQALFEVAHSTGAEVSRWQARSENGWALDLDELKGLLRPNTRAIILNTPHNPTGWLMPRAELEALAELAEERGIILFSDEVYRELEHDPARRLPAGCDLSQTAVSLGVMSKAYGLAGLRIGWVATRNQAVLRRMAELKDYTTICASAPSEFLAEIALRHRQELAGRNLEIIRRNLDLLDDFFARHPRRFAWRRPTAGPIAFPGLLGELVEPFCHRLAERAGVLLLPGTVYDDPGSHFRLGFGRKNLPGALERLEAFLESDKG